MIQSAGSTRALKDERGLKAIHTCSMQFHSELECLSNAVDDILSVLRNHFGYIEEGNLFELRVILNELLINAMKHGNHCLPDKCVKVRVGITGDDFAYLIIEDEGEGYNVHDILARWKKPADPMDLFGMSESGRGLHIVNTLSNRVRINQKGNKVIVLKKIFRQHALA